MIHKLKRLDTKLRVSLFGLRQEYNRIFLQCNLRDARWAATVETKQSTKEDIWIFETEQDVDHWIAKYLREHLTETYTPPEVAAQQLKEFYETMEAKRNGQQIAVRR